MRLSIDQQMVKAIDTLTRQHSMATASKGELKQLSTLFGKSYLGSLRRLLQGSFVQHPGARFDVTIRLAWIDKIPLADIRSEPERTELGDAVLFAFDELVMPHRQLSRITGARAALLQAKVTDKRGQIAKPTVPISAMKDSTKKEFDLLSLWPPFDLFKASNSDTPLAQNIDLRGTKSGTLPYGWYIAAPRLRSSAKRANTKQWTSWWMAGPPILNHDCDVSFGSLLQAFFAERLVTSAGNLEVGASFECEVYPPPPIGLAGWDRICAEIIEIVENSNAPQSVFGLTPIGRMAKMSTIGAPVGSSTFLAGSEESLAYQAGSGPHPARIPTTEGRLRRLVRRLLDRLQGRKRIPVLIFHTRLTEGSGI